MAAKGHMKPHLCHSECTVDSDHHYIASLANATLSHGRFVAAFQANTFVQTKAVTKSFLQHGSSRPRRDQPFATHSISSQVVEMVLHSHLHDMLLRTGLHGVQLVCDLPDGSVTTFVYETRKKNLMMAK